MTGIGPWGPPMRADLASVIVPVNRSSQPTRCIIAWKAAASVKSSSGYSVGERRMMDQHDATQAFTPEIG